MEYFQRAKRGQFSLIFSLFELIPDAKEAKAHLDHVIDLCGPPSKGNCLFLLVLYIQWWSELNFIPGTGLQNLRECIQWTHEKFCFEPKKKRPFWKQMSINFIERYFYLICFATYAKTFAKRGKVIFRWKKTFWDPNCDWLSKIR